MIIEQIIEDGKRVRHYSDSAVMIRQIETGNIYEDAVDVVPCRYTYEETDEPIPTEEYEPDVRQRVADLEGISRDTDGMAIDHEMRLTMLELGLN